MKHLLIIILSACLILSCCIPEKWDLLWEGIEQAEKDKKDDKDKN